MVKCIRYVAQNAYKIPDETRRHQEPVKCNNDLYVT